MVGPGKQLQGSKHAMHVSCVISAMAFACRARPWPAWQVVERPMLA
jgi:hypothetical protein